MTPAMTRENCAPRFGLYVVVPNSAWTERLADQVPVVQLRCKSADQEFCAREIRAALHAVTGTTTHLFINDHWRLAMQYGVYGVHLRQEDIDTADLDAIRRALHRAWRCVVCRPLPWAST